MISNYIISAGIYRHVGAGGTVMRPTKTGPAMIFNNVKNHGDARALIGTFSSRKRVAKLLGFRFLNAAIEEIMPYQDITGMVPMFNVDFFSREYFFIELMALS